MHTIIAVSAYFENDFIEVNQANLSVFIEKIVTGFFDLLVENSIFDVDKYFKKNTEREFIQVMKQTLYRINYVENISELKKIEKSE